MPRSSKTRTRKSARPGGEKNSELKLRPEAPKGPIEVAGRQLKLSNLDKVLYPREGFTKGQVIEYYARIADVLLPHLRGRPLTLKRYPDGVDAEFFYEKMCPSHRPEWVSTTKIASTGGKRPFVQYCLVEDLPTLIWVANLASLELHTLLSREDDVSCPTTMVFDLDPGPGMNLIDCIAVARRFREMLHSLGLESCPKTSGGKGLHLYVPLNTRVTFDETKHLARAMAQMLEKEDPQRITSKMRKDHRHGRIFVDWSQNDDHKTTVCAYSLRARERPTVSTPVTWDELETAYRRKDSDRLVFTCDDVLKRVEKLGDIFEPVLKLKQKLPRPED